MRINGRFAKWGAGAAVLGALALASPRQAGAQVRFGLEVGAYPAPVYAPAYPYGCDRFARERWLERQRWEAERAREIRHEQWLREHWRDRGWYGGRY